MLLGLVPNRILTYAIAKVVPRRSKTLDDGGLDAKPIGLYQRPFCQSDIEYQSNVSGTCFRGNAIEVHGLPVLVFIALHIEKNCADNVNIAFHKANTLIETNSVHGIAHA